MARLALLSLLGGCGAKTVKSAESPVPVMEQSAVASVSILGDDGAIAATLLGGKRVELRDFGAPVTVIAMWAIYCAPCLEELPYIEALHQKYKSDPNVSIIAVNIDEVDEPDQLAKVKAIVTRLGLSLPVLVNGGDIMKFLVPADAKGNQRIVLPLVAIIDRNLTIRHEVGFPTDTNEDAYVRGKVALIDAALAGELENIQGHESASVPQSGSELKMELPSMSDEKLLVFLIEFRATMKKTFPAFTDAALDRLVEDARAASKSGKPLVFVIP